MNHTTTSSDHWDKTFVPQKCKNLSKSLKKLSSLRGSNKYETKDRSQPIARTAQHPFFWLTVTEGNRKHLFDLARMYICRCRYVVYVPTTEPFYETRSSPPPVSITVQGLFVYLVVKHTELNRTQNSKTISRGRTVSTGATCNGCRKLWT